MNICFVLIEYPKSLVNDTIVDDFSGGAGVIMYQIAHLLKARGHNITILTRTTNDQHIGSFWDKGIEVHKLYAKSSLLESINITNKLKLITQEKKIDIIETCDYAPLLYEVPKDIPLLMRLHLSHGLINFYKGKTNTPYDRNDRSCLQRSFEFHLADSVSGVSNFILEKQRKFHSLEQHKIYGVIYNGIDPSRYNTSNYDKYILFCHGTLSKRKGTDKVCEIYDNIKKHDINIKLDIIGNGEEFWKSHCINKLSEKAKQDSNYSGFLAHNETIHKISKAGIYISMSEIEAMSISLLEAMILGKPVVLLKNGVFEEIIDDGKEGFLVNSKEEAVSRIIELLNNENLYHKMSQLAHKKAMLFTLDRSVDETEKWYEFVLKNKQAILSRREKHFIELMKEYYKELQRSTKA